jgi:hypothetical protein
VDSRWCAKSIGVRSLPCTIVIDQNGNFAAEKLPGMDFTEIVKKLMAQ